MQLQIDDFVFAGVFSFEGKKRRTEQSRERKRRENGKSGHREKSEMHTFRWVLRAHFRFLALQHLKLEVIKSLLSKLQLGLYIIITALYYHTRSHQEDLFR